MPLLGYPCKGRKGLSRGRQRNVWLRRALGVAAAYAFALQVLLGSIVATQMAVAAPNDDLALCSGELHDAGDPSGKPAPRLAHASCLVCAFASFVPPVPKAPTVYFGAASQSQFWPTLPTSIRIADRREPRSSRGPPQVA